MLDNENLAARVEPLNGHYANMIRKSPCELKQLSTPFFARGVVYRVTCPLRTRPVVFTVGCAGTDLTVLLADNPSGYVELAEAAQVRLDDNEDRVGYVSTFLRTTRSFAHRFELIESVSDVKPRPNLSDEDIQRFERFQEAYRSIIVGPQVSGTGPWEVVAYALKQQSLIRIDITLEPNGGIEAKETVLEDDVPLPYTL